MGGEKIKGKIEKDNWLWKKDTILNWRYVISFKEELGVLEKILKQK